MCTSVAFAENTDEANLLYIHNENRKKTKKTAKKQRIFGASAGVWEDEFSVGKPFCSGAGEKETQTLKVVWELKRDVRRRRRRRRSL